MKSAFSLSASRDDLLKVLGQGSGIVERRQTLPILANVLIEHTAHGAQFTTSDMDVQIRAQAGEAVQISEGAAITVNVRKLLEILRTASPGTVSMDLKDNKVTVKAGKSRFNLQTLPAQDFPLVRQADDLGQALRLPQKAFKRLLGLAHFAMAQNDVRYYLNGMLLKSDGQQMHLVGTDGHRISHAAATLENEAEPFESILPRKTVLELMRLLSDDDEAMIGIETAKNQARFTLDGLEFTSKLIEGKFPDYRRVVPKGHSNKLEIERAALQSALQRVAIMTNDKFKGVRVNLEPGLLRLASVNAEQEEAQEEIDIDYSGARIETGFNITYLIDALTNIPSEGVRIEMQDDKSGALITMPGDKDFQHVVTPMRI